MIGNDERECGTAKAHTIKILWIGRPGMEVSQTQQNSLTGNADGGCSTTTMSIRFILNCIVYSPNKYRETEGIKDIGTQFWNQGRTEEIKDRVLHL